MNPLSDLRALLRQPSRAQGTVVRVEPGRVHIATGRGVVIATQRDATAYRPGETVWLSNGVLQGRTRAAGTRPTYVV